LTDVKRAGSIWGVGLIACLLAILALWTGVAAEPRAMQATPLAATPVAGGHPPEVTIYFLRNDFVGATKRTVDAPSDTEDTALALAAVETLIAGPTAEERAAGLTTSIPEGTEVRDLSLEDAVATIDFTSAFIAGNPDLDLPQQVAQVVYTLTAIGTIEQVQIQIDGSALSVGLPGVDANGPMGRADLEAQTPPILVESPRVGETVCDPIRVHGTANTYEGSFHLEIVQIVNGQNVILAKQQVQTSGSGTRGAFDVTVDVAISAAGPGKLILFQIAPSGSGTLYDVTEIPLLLEV
jgi:hypothetical protein